MLMNIFMYIFVIFEAVVGLGSTFCILFLLFYTLGQKIYGKVKYGKSLYD